MFQNSTCLGFATIQGYDMYDFGSYPAIVPGDNPIIGELYQIPVEDMPVIDMLEGEDYLYIKKCERITQMQKEKLPLHLFMFILTTVQALGKYLYGKTMYVMSHMKAICCMKDLCAI